MTKCSFDKNVITISQYGGVVHGFEGKKYAALSHYDYRATDFSIAGENKLYAPCALKCVFHNYIEDFECVASVFETIGSVSCADGTPRELTFMMLHGGTENGGSFKLGDSLSSVPELKKTYKKNDHIYKAGLDGLGSGAHIHVDILNGHITNDGQETITESELRKYVELYVQPYFPEDTYGLDAGKSLNFHEVFFDTKGISFSTKLNGGDITAAEVWGSDVSFTKSSIEEEIPFNPAGKEDGEYEYEGDYYYVKNHSLAKGWVEFDKGKFKFYRETDGRRVTDDWLGIPTGVGDRLKYYYMDEEGFMLADQWVTKSNGRFYVGADGVMLEKWHKLKKSNTSTQTATYYLNPDPNYPDGYPVISGFEHGQMVKSSWIASGKRWCFVRSGGEMLFSCQTEINGKWYKFDADGYCVEPDGSDTKYPNIPEVEA